MASSTISNLVSSIPPIVDQDKKLIKRGRVKTPKDAKTVWTVLFDEDRASSIQRALYQEMLDGKPPSNPAKLVARGLGGTTNINWNLAQQAQEEAEMPYNNLLESLDKFTTLPTKHGEPEERMIWEPIMEEELPRILRKWGPFNSLWQYNVHLFTAEGVSFAMFEDERNWQWKIKGLQHLKIPRSSRADVNELDVVACKVATMPHTLYHIAEREGSDLAGWNRNAIKKALIDTVKYEGVESNDYQAWVARWKDNDLSESCKAAKLDLLHLWIKELDGTVTRLICREDGEGEFLYKSEGKIREMGETLVPFLFNVGTNGDFHSVRGLASKVFPMASGINRAFNRMIDLTMHIATPHLRSTSEDGNIDAMIQHRGVYAVLHSSAEPVEMPVPSMEQTVIPIINMLQGFLGARTSTYTQGLPNQLDRTERTATEKRMQYAQQGQLSSSGVNLFFSAWGKLLKEVVRRMIRKDYQQDEPGGVLAWEFRNRCMDRGVPVEAIESIDIDAMEINTGIGKGSAAERMTTIDGVGQMYPEMDSYAKNEFNRMRTAAYIGTQKAEMLFPRQPGQRPPLEAGMATLENELMATKGQPLEVEPNQDHFTHLTKHMPFLQEWNQRIIDGQTTMEEAIPQMKPVWEHSNMHLEQLPITNRSRGEIKQALQQLGEVIQNQYKKLVAAQQKAQAEQEQMGAEGQPQGGNDRTANDLIQSVQAGMKLDALQKEMDLKNIERQQELAHRDKKAAQELYIMSAKAAAQNALASKSKPAAK